MEKTFSELPVYLAPLAGITDAAMRQICIEEGNCLTFTEMVSVNGLFYKNKRTNELLSLAKDEKSVGVQLFGADAQTVRKIAGETQQRMAEKVREININMGCPAPKIVKNGEGCALMLDMKRAFDIISAAKKEVNVPLTVKFRKGFYENDDLAAQFAKMCEDAGADMIYVHGRTREQYYAGVSDRNAVRQAVRAVSIPVIGNGDIFCAQDAVSLTQETGCAGIMVARGALGNPFIFREIDALKKGLDIPKITASERARAFLKQLDYAICEKGEKLAIKQMRKHAAYYLKGGKNSAKARAKAVIATSRQEFEEIFNKYAEN